MQWNPPSIPPLPPRERSAYHKQWCDWRHHLLNQYVFTGDANVRLPLRREQAPATMTHSSSMLKKRHEVPQHPPRFLTAGGGVGHVAGCWQGEGRGYDRCERRALFCQGGQGDQGPVLCKVAGERRTRGGWVDTRASRHGPARCWVRGMRGLCFCLCSARALRAAVERARGTSGRARARVREPRLLAAGKGGQTCQSAGGSTWT